MRKMKRLAARQTVVVVPVVVEPVEIHDPAVVIEVKVRNVEIAVGVVLKYALHRPNHCPLNTLRAVSYSET